MELSAWLLPYHFFCLPCPLSVFHTHKAPSLFSFIFRTQFKLSAPPSQAQWQRAQFFCLACPLSMFHTHKAPLNREATKYFCAYLISCTRCGGTCLILFTTLFQAFIILLETLNLGLETLEWENMHCHSCVF